MGLGRHNMTYKICEWDNNLKCQIERDATQEEILQRNIDIENSSKPVVAASVSRRQGRQALLMQGLLDKVQPIIDAISDTTQKSVAQIYWDDAQDYERGNIWVITIGSALGLSSDQIDSLFITASKL